MRHRLWVQGKWLESDSSLSVKSPSTGKEVARADQLTATQLEAALQGAHDAFKVFRKTSRAMRSRLCLKVAELIQSRRAELIELIVNEAGKPWTLADAEVTRSIGTFTIAAEAAKSFSGETLPIDIDPAGRPYQSAHWRWVPRGPVLGITPFNFPLNLVAHKVAPAMAVGTSIILKPPPQAPGAATLLASIFETAAREVSDERESVPMAAFQVVHGANAVIEEAVKDPRIAVLTFTGSDRAGWMLRNMAGHKKVVLELGGNAAVIIHRDADLARAASRCAFGAFAYAGQVCISIQRILVHQEVAAEFVQKFTHEVKKVKVGDPQDKATLVGPMISMNEADRLMGWIDEAKADGAEIILGGTRQGSVIAPTIVRNIKPTHKLWSEEAFGPVVAIDTYDRFEEALQKVNDSRFGLQAGVFSDSARILDQASDELEVGGVLLNEIPTYRADNMPYGGMKDSGTGREGVRYAMEEYCDRKAIVSWRG